MVCKDWGIFIRKQIYINREKNLKINAILPNIFLIIQQYTCAKIKALENMYVSN